MKKKIALLLAAVMLVLSLGLAACGGNTDGPGADKTPVQVAAEDGILKIGLDPEFPPMGFRDADTGELVGFDIDLAKEVAERIGMEFEAVPINWDTKKTELEAGSFDCVWNGFTMNGREADYTWTTAYIKNAQVVVVKEDSTVAKATDLAGKTVALQQGSTAENALNARADVKDSLKSAPLYVENNVMGFTELKAGAVDALIVDEVVANYYIANNPGFKVIESLGDEEYGIGFALGNEEMRDLVQAALEEMAADGTMKQISEKWFGKDVTVIGK